jgi:sec-independent protein translocase protein TatA
MVAEIASPDVLVVIAVVLLVLFGGSKLPELARSLGRAKKEFEDAVAPDRPEPSASTSDADAEFGGV